MTIRHMKIFVAVYQNESITRAAEQLYMTQPAVTRAIQELERNYGVRLFERINQRLSTTEAGRKLYAYALHIIDSFDHIDTELKNWDQLGVIRIGASTTLGSILLPRMIKEFQKTHPGIALKCMITNGTRLQQKLENNELDFALIEGKIANDNLVIEPFSEDRLILLLPPDSRLAKKEKVTLKDLRQEPLLLSEKDSVSRILVERIFALHNMTVEPMMESISTHAIVQSVHQGIGISFLPERLVHHSVESGFIASRPVEEESFIRTNYIAWHKNKLITQAAENLFVLCHNLSQQFNEREEEDAGIE